MSEQQDQNSDVIEVTRDEAEAIVAQWRRDSNDYDMTEEQDRLAGIALEYRRRASEFESEENYVLAARYYQKADDVLEPANLGSHHFRVWGHYKLGVCYYYAKDYEMGSRYLLLALEGYLSHKSSSSDFTAANIYTLLGHLYRDQEQYEIAIEFYKKSLEILISQNCRKLSACTQNYIGRCYCDIEEHDEAIKYYSMTLDMIDVVGEETVEAHSRLGVIYREAEMYDEAIECHQSAIDLAVQLSGEQSPDAARELNRIAITYRYMGQYDEAIEHYQHSLEIYENQEDVDLRMVARVLENLAMGYVHAEQVGSAMECFGRLLSLLRELDGDDDEHVTEIEEYMANLDLSYRLSPLNVKPS